MASSGSLLVPHVVAQVTEYASASACLSPTAAYGMDALVETCKLFMKNKAMGFVRKADGRALLASYGSDGTPLITRQHWRHKTGSLGDVHRHGNSSHEYLIQRCFSHTVRMGRPSWIRSSRSRYLWRVARTRCSCSIARACFSPRSEGRAIRAWLCNTFASIAVASLRQKHS